MVFFHLFLLLFSRSFFLSFPSLDCFPFPSTPFHSGQPGAGVRCSSSSLHPRSRDSVVQSSGRPHGVTELLHTGRHVECRMHLRRDGQRNTPLPGAGKQRSTPAYLQTPRDSESPGLAGGDTAPGIQIGLACLLPSALEEDLLEAG